MAKTARGKSSIDPSGFLASGMTRVIQARRARDKVVARDLALGGPRSELVDCRDVLGGVDELIFRECFRLQLYAQFASQPVLLEPNVVAQKTKQRLAARRRNSCYVREFTVDRPGGRSVAQPRHQREYELRGLGYLPAERPYCRSDRPNPCQFVHADVRTETSCAYGDDSQILRTQRPRQPILRKRSIKEKLKCGIIVRRQSTINEQARRLIRDNFDQFRVEIMPRCRE